MMIKKYKIGVVMLMLLIITTLLACSSDEMEEHVTSAEAAIEMEETEEISVEEAKAEAISTEEPTPEPTKEPTPEPTPIVYEGVDIESTLPGTEWVESFSGLINEPKLVVYNDTTNKKIILEEGQEVEFEKDDVLAIYSPIDAICIKQFDYMNFNVSKLGMLVMSLEEISDYAWEKGKVTSNIIVEHEGKDVELSCTLIFKEE